MGVSTGNAPTIRNGAAARQQRASTSGSVVAVAGSDQVTSHALAFGVDGDVLVKEGELVGNGGRE